MRIFSCLANSIEPVRLKRDWPGSILWPSLITFGSRKVTYLNINTITVVFFIKVIDKTLNF